MMTFMMTFRMTLRMTLRMTFKTWYFRGVFKADFKGDFKGSRGLSSGSGPGLSGSGLQSGHYLVLVMSLELDSSVKRLVDFVIDKPKSKSKVPTQSPGSP